MNSPWVSDTRVVVVSKLNAERALYLTTVTITYLPMRTRVALLRYLILYMSGRLVRTESYENGRQSVPEHDAQIIGSHTATPHHNTSNIYSGVQTRAAVVTTTPDALSGFSSPLAPFAPAPPPPPL